MFDIDTTSGLVMEAVDYHYPRAELAAVSVPALHAGPGESVAITGGNGCGKTTLLRLAAGILTPQRGSIRLDGEPVHSARQRIAWIGADFDMFEYLTLEQNVRFFVQFYGEQLDPVVMDAMFQRYDLAAAHHRVAGAASRGMRRKTQLIAALLQRPRLILADEAMDGLDVAARSAWIEDLRQLTTSGGITLWSSHDEELIRSSADRVVRLDQPLTPKSHPARTAPATPMLR